MDSKWRESTRVLIETDICYLSGVFYCIPSGRLCIRGERKAIKGNSKRGHSKPQG